MTLWKKLLRRLVNLLVERYFPNSAFFGPKYLDVFQRVPWPADEHSSMMVGSCFAYMARTATGNFADEITLTVEGLKLHGEPLGDWRYTFERIGSDEGGDT